MIRAAVITVSHRASEGIYPDRSGPLLVEGLQALGCEVSTSMIVDDGEPVKSALLELTSAHDLIITTGGTGISPTDRTPEMTAAILDYQVPGIADAIRNFGSSAGVATAVLSRGVAGVRGQTLIINLPGSPGAIRDGLKVLEPILDHAMSQLRGGDH